MKFSKVIGVLFRNEWKEISVVVWERGEIMIDPRVVFSVPKEKPISLVTVFRTTEHIVKSQFRWLCSQGADGLHRGQIPLELLRNLASTNMSRTAGPQRRACRESPDT